MTKKTEAGKTEQRKVQIVLPDLTTLTKNLYQRGILGVLVVSIAMVTFVGGGWGPIACHIGVNPGPRGRGRRQTGHYSFGCE